MGFKRVFFSSYKKFYGEESIRIRPVTVFVGKNSSGKSSILKLFPMLANSLSGHLHNTPFLFQNQGVSLGVSFRNISHNGNSVGLSFGASIGDSFELTARFVSQGAYRTPQISEEIICYEGKEFNLIFDNGSFRCPQLSSSFADSDFNGFLCRPFLEQIGVDLCLFDGLAVDYLGPYRCIPDRIHFDRGIGNTNKVGYDGNQAYDIICSNPDLVSRVSEWFEDCFDNCKLDVSSVGDGYQISFLKGPIQLPVNILDEGQGIVQVFPIIVRCNLCIPDSLVIIEQPELHLHPAAHASLARLFAKTSIQNNQSYCIETHSENILLGLRDAVVDPDVNFTSDDVVIYFVDEDEEGAYLSEITINEKGELSSWPVGVFNESYDLLTDIIRKSERQ